MDKNILHPCNCKLYFFPIIIYMPIENTTLQCSLYDIMDLPMGCCGQFLYYSKARWWRWYSCWKKKYFQYKDNRIDIWSLNKTHKACKVLKIKRNTRITQIDVGVHRGVVIYKFSIIKGGGKYHHMFSSPRREKILILWKNIYEFISENESFSTFIPE